jgi:hypothetical protein
MNEYSFLTEGLAHFILYATLGAAIFMIAVLSTYTKFRWRIPLMVIFFTTFMGVSYYSLGELLGKPKPVGLLSWDRPDVEEARVLGQFFEEGKGIYLLLTYPGQKIPRYYQFPWNDDMAKQLKRGKQGEQSQENKGVLLKYPFQKSHEDREFPEVYEIPWPMPPPKDQQNIQQIDLDAIDV